MSSDPERAEWVKYESTHDVIPVAFTAYVTRDKANRESGVHYVCQRCGALAGSERFKEGCRKFQHPGKRHESKRPSFRKPRQGATETFSEELCEYYEQVDSFGGLSSVFGAQLEIARNGGGHVQATEAKLPAYMGDARGVREKRERLRAVYHALICLTWQQQVALSKYYDGTRSLDDEIRVAHTMFTGWHRRPQHSWPHEQRGRKWTTKELAEKAGVSRQHMHTLIRDAGVGRVESGGESVALQTIVYEDDLEELKETEIMRW